MELVNCGDCGARMVLRNSKHGPFYGCSQYPRCKGAHGAHPDGRPLGIPADLRTRRSRMAAHAAFDALWKRGEFFADRTEAYRWLDNLCRLPPDGAHIAQFSRIQCEWLIDKVVAFRRDRALSQRIKGYQ